MAAGCRDCARCTESAFWSLLMLPVRFLIWVCGGFLFNVFRSWCPQCRHAMGGHRRIGGRLAD